MSSSFTTNFAFGSHITRSASNPGKIHPFETNDMTFYSLPIGRNIKGIFSNEVKTLDISMITFRCSNPAKVAGFNDISRCISNNEIPSFLDAVHMRGRENCMEADIPPIAKIKFPSPIALSFIQTRLNSKGQGR